MRHTDLCLVLGVISAACSSSAKAPPEAPAQPPSTDTAPPPAVGTAPPVVRVPAAVAWCRAARAGAEPGVEAPAAASAPPESLPPLPTLRMGNITTTGGADKATIRDHMLRVLDRISYCYESHLRPDTQVTGALAATLDIEPTGKVARASASGPAPEIAACITGVLQSMALPPPKGKTRASALVQIKLETAGSPDRPSEKAPRAPAADAPKTARRPAPPPPVAPAVPAQRPVAPGVKGESYGVAFPDALTWAGPDGDRDLDAWDAGAITPALAAASLSPCRGESTPPGAVRVVIGVDTSGAIAAVGAGDLDDKAAVSCVAAAARAISVGPPPRPHIAECEVTFSDGAPELVIPGPGDLVVEVRPRAIQIGSFSLDPGDPATGDLAPLRQTLANVAGLRGAFPRVVIRIASDTDAALVIRTLEIASAEVRSPLVVGIELTPERFVAVGVRLQKKTAGVENSGPGTAGELMALVTPQHVGITVLGLDRSGRAGTAPGSMRAAFYGLRAQRDRGPVLITAATGVPARRFAEVAVAAAEVGLGRVEVQLRR